MKQRGDTERADATAVEYYNPERDHYFFVLDGLGTAIIRAQGERTPLGQAAWRFEGYGMTAALPVNGQCPANLAPVYRAYNNGGRTGAPNFRYLTEVSAYRAMEAKGWTAEGIAFCVPPAASREARH